MSKLAYKKIHVKINFALKYFQFSRKRINKFIIPRQKQNGEIEQALLTQKEYNFIYILIYHFDFIFIC